MAALNALGLSFYWIITYHGATKMSDLSPIVATDAAEKGQVMDVEIDRDGLWRTLCCRALFAPPVIGALFAWPCIMCYTQSQKATVSSEEVTLSYDLSLCGSKERHVPMDRIQDVTLSVSPCDKVCGTQVIAIQTAGGGGPESEISIIAPVDGKMVRDTIMAYRHNKKGGDGVSADAPLLSGSGSERNPLNTAQSQNELRELKESVLRIENLVGEGLKKM